jgi:F-type H+-transporting ATPase subunit b
MDTLKQIGELLLSSIPTIILLLIVWIAYRNIVQRKLERVLGERHARTEGAIQEAQSEITKAETRTAEYEQRLRAARAHVYQTQEARRRHMMEERGAALAEARRQADERVKHAAADLRKDAEEAKAGLAHQAEALAREIIHSILKPLAATEGR